MPASSRALAANLKEHRPYRTVLSISHTGDAGTLYDRLVGLAFNVKQRRDIEQCLATQVASILRLDIASHELLLDVFRPKTWDMNGWICINHPSGGMPEYRSWSEATHGMRNEVRFGLILFHGGNDMLK